MKKSILALVSILPAFCLSSQVHAESAPVSLELGGAFSGYVVYHTQDNATTTSEERSVDIMRETVLTLEGETTLDNGLTVGVTLETAADIGDNFTVNDSYIYFSGDWGRVNFGGTDGASALLQVAAPAADPFIDGVEQFINPVNYDLMLNLGGSVDVSMHYLMGQTGAEDKITYISPLFSGLQIAASYTPEMNDGASRSLGGVSRDDQEEDYGDAWEAALRYERTINDLTFVLGAGYAHVSLEKDVTGAGTDTLDDQSAWDAGLALTYKNWGAGIAYVTDDNGLRNSDTDIIVVGADYTTGPWRIGASYYDREDSLENLGLGSINIETNRYSGGVTYNVGAGMDMLGSVHYIEHDIAGSSDPDATSVVLGTRVSF